MDPVCAHNRNVYELTFPIMDPLFDCHAVHLTAIVA